MSIWPFGTSAKDRKRIAALEHDVTDLRSQLRLMRGEPSPFSTRYHYAPSLCEIANALESLAKADDEIMSAAGLVRMTQPSKTWIQKKASK